MQIPVGKWYDAVFKRRSRRQFSGEPITPEVFSTLEDFTNQLNIQLSGARTTIVNGNTDAVFKGNAGAFGIIKNAPAYAAFIGDVNDPNVQEKVGYMGECFILEATAMGLATCWVGGSYRPGNVKKQITIGQNEQIIAVSPLGYSPEKYSFQEKLMSGFTSGHKRKDIEALCRPLGFNRDWPAWIKSALEVGRLAPSAVNRQPWRFSVDTDAIKLSVDHYKDSFDISRRLDCGIAMLHIEIGAGHKGITGQWEYLEHPDVAIFKAKRDTDTMI